MKNRQRDLEHGRAMIEVLDAVRGHEHQVFDALPHGVKRQIMTAWNRLAVIDAEVGRTRAPSVVHDGCVTLAGFRSPAEQARHEAKVAAK